MFRYVFMFLTATNIYLFLKLHSGFGRGWWNIVYIAWAVAWAALGLTSQWDFFGMGERVEFLYSTAFTRAAIVGIACAIFLVIDISSLFAKFIDVIFGASFISDFFNPRKYVPIVILLTMSISVYSYYEAWNVRRVSLEMETSKLPEGIDRLRLVHISDVHLASGLFTINRLRKIMDIASEAEPDILVYTGDLIDSRTSFFEEEAVLLALCKAKWGVYAVTGNHEFISGGVGRTVDFMKRADITLLRDAKIEIAGITILGVDEQLEWRKRWPDELHIAKDRFVLLLKHRPDIIKDSDGKFDLQLSGHTHGGQIWPFGYATQRANNSVQKLSYIGDSAIYVSNGAGFWGPALRFLTPPEVTVIDLVRAES
ncbi:MAG: metallophosphoesterase [Synergistaceae bacterium]|nr:metallophosphoesterase [Synergistaceae bacterium]